MVLGVVVVWLVCTLVVDLWLWQWIQFAEANCIAELKRCGPAEEFNYVWKLSTEQLAQISLVAFFGRLLLSGVMLLAYLFLLAPMLGYASALMASRAAGMTNDTRRRLEWLDRMRPGFLLLVTVASLAALNALDAATQFDAHTSDVRDDLLRNALATVKPGGLELAALAKSNAGLYLAGLTLVPVAVIVGHFLLLMELPFWIGQRRWKHAQVKTAIACARDRQQKLLDRANASEKGLADPIQLMLPLAHYYVASETLRAAREIPVHTVKSVWDAALKLGRSAVLAAITVVLHTGGLAAAATTAVGGGAPT
jgi:hypothetical protein